MLIAPAFWLSLSTVEHDRQQHTKMCDWTCLIHSMALLLGRPGKPPHWSSSIYGTWWSFRCFELISSYISSKCMPTGRWSDIPILSNLVIRICWGRLVYTWSKQVLLAGRAIHFISWFSPRLEVYLRWLTWSSFNAFMFMSPKSSISLSVLYSWSRVFCNCWSISADDSRRYTPTRKSGQLDLQGAIFTQRSYRSLDS